MNARRPRALGIALVEALIALAVAALGTMALLGLQSMLRAHADLARQRTEAARIAQDAIEDVRAYGAVEAGAGIADFAGIASDGPVTIAGLNALYERRRIVDVAGVAPLKSITVIVHWRDRSGEMQSVTLRSAIAAVPPELAGALSLRRHGPPAGSPWRLPHGRHAGIPLQAKDLDDGRSVFMPPQDAGGGVAWEFDNRSGRITGICNVAPGRSTASLTAADLAGCSGNASAQLLAGFVRFADTATAPDAAAAAQPTGSALNLDLVLAGASCFDDAPADAATAAGRTAVAYYCAAPGPVWSGRARVLPLGVDGGAPWTIGSGAGAYRVCRYTTLAGDAGDAAGHPLDQVDVDAPLTHRNFLVVAATHDCPAAAPPDGDADHAHTRLHQDGSPGHDNP